MDRRRFLARTAVCAAATAALPRVWAEEPAVRPPRPLRVRGAVRGAGKGLSGVGVSDGRRFVGTQADGTFELVTTTDREFVQVNVPAGYRIPVAPNGTAAAFRRLAPSVGSEVEAVFDLEPLGRSDERHVAFLLADPQTEDLRETGLLHAETVPDVRAALNGLGDVERFGLACGDMMFNNLELFPEYERAVTEMGIPFFQVVGNHDLNFEGRVDEASTRTFCERFGPRYYAFDRGAVHYVVLDDVFWNGREYFGYLDADQLGWLADDLSRVEAGRTVVVATHIPTLGSTNARGKSGKAGPSASVTDRELLYRLLEPYRAHLLAGHLHETEHAFEQGIHEHVAGAVCGAWWSGPICADGTPNGYAIYETAGESVTWRYQATGLPASHQMRLYPREGSVLANVWDWDPAWKVLWYEDGARRGEMARETGLDPLSVELHAGRDLPARRKWVEPYTTAHLFRAKHSKGAKRVTVEATDRFGRTYREDVTCRT